MCLVTKSEHPIVAEKPITCYKVLWNNTRKNKLCSFFYSEFEWKMDEVHNTSLQEGEKLEDGRGTVYQGFHSYKSLHSAIMFISQNPLSSCVVAECIIPKGAKYYVGEDGHNRDGYASDKLMPIEVITIEELITKLYDNYPFKKGYTMMIKSKYIPSSPGTFTIANIHIYESFVRLSLESTTPIDGIFSHTYYMDTDFEGNPSSKNESIIAYGTNSLKNPETEPRN